MEFDLHGLQDLTYWVRDDRRKAQKILILIEEVVKTPFYGIGKTGTIKAFFDKMLVSTN